MSETVRFEIEIGTGIKRAHLYTTRSLLLLYRSAPMGVQVTLVWYKDVERVVSGMKKGNPYVQLLGEASRLLIVFSSKSIRDSYKRKCLTYIEA